MAPAVAIKPSKVALPSQTSNADARRAGIADRRSKLGYNYTSLPKLAVAKGLPIFEELSDAYVFERMAASAPIVGVTQTLPVLQTFDVVNRMEDFDDFFIKPYVETPALVKDAKWNTDSFFAEQRLSGANPMIIQLLERDDPRAEVLMDMENLPFNAKSELSKANIYICDYSGTDPAYRGPTMVTGGESNAGMPQYLPKPIAWFRWVEDKKNKNGGELEPVAIQLDASLDPSVYERKHSRVWTPNEKHELDWTFAKICVQVADSLHHEMSSHLARCHFTMEPIAVAVKRTMAEEHPIALLINTHMRFHIANDSVAFYTLVGKNGNVDNLMPGTLRESMALLTEAYDKWDLIGMNFPNDLQNRRVANDDRLPHFPYRDDGKLLWEAIETWVDSFVSGFYKTDGDVANDLELQDFAAECYDQKSGAKVKGMPRVIETKSVLAEILASIIFVCGPGHGAINFAQYDYMAFVPNMPLSLYQDVSIIAEQETPITEEQLMTILPDAKQAQAQLEIVFNLVAYKFDQFGDYDRTFMEWYGVPFAEHFKDSPEVVKAYTAFRAKLNQVENVIKKRNKTRPNPYSYMQPSKLLNSISI